ncbi:hypothetical protein [Nocardioides sp. GXQ0305]|uniref:hypothetical protein n=1 Tax=Nocardioides sp. GXQ0305 TaxID=3423912 RepID=UPI003D7C5022
MSATARRFVGIGNIAAGGIGLVVLIAAYGLAEQMVVAQEGAPAGALAKGPLLPWGPELQMSLNMSLLLLGAAAGLVGSVIQQSIVFALRAGHESLERGYVWWYLLRPVWSMLLGAVSVIAVNAGFVSIGDATTSAAGVTVLATAGALAGLSTDQALQKVQRLLGATPPAAPASEATPGPT